MCRCRCRVQGSFFNSGSAVTRVGRPAERRVQPMLAASDARRRGSAFALSPHLSCVTRRQKFRTAERVYTAHNPVRLPAMRAHPAMTEAHDQSPPADLACIDRWLVHGQSQHPTRACPLCRRDPLLAVNSASAGEGEQDGLSDDEEGTRSGHGARAVSSAALAAQRGRIERRVSEGSPRRVIGVQARRCSDSVAASAAASTQLILL